MVADQKGRSGKKPKYQIADIGGSDLTSQDISTERVLNFLIKGELASAADHITDTEREGLAAANTSANTSPEQTPTDRSNDPVETSLPPPVAQGKKSLAHLFQRASSGGGTVKDLKLDLSAKELVAETPSESQLTHQELSRLIPSNNEVESEIKGANQSPQMPAANDAAPVISAPSSITTQPNALLHSTESRTVAAKEVVTAPFRESEELARLPSLWKSFYRLNDGEIDALSALYRMSHDVGSSDCYIKMRKLAEMSNLTYRYCQKVVRSLEQLGWITKLKDYDPSTQIGVLYRINLKPIL